MRPGAASDDHRLVSEANADGDVARPSSRSRQRTFEIVFALLTLHFASLAVTYLVDPGFAVRQFSRANERLGGVKFAPPDVTAWRYATVCGMATLALMTLLMLVDLDRNYPLLVPAAFFKVLNAVLWFWYSATNRDLPVFLVAGIYDLLVVALMVWAARRAHEAIRPFAARGRSGAQWSPGGPSSGAGGTNYAQPPSRESTRPGSPVSVSSTRPSSGLGSPRALRHRSCERYVSRCGC